MSRSTLAHRADSGGEGGGEDASLVQCASWAACGVASITGDPRLDLQYSSIHHPCQSLKASTPPSLTITSVIDLTYTQAGTTA